MAFLKGTDWVRFVWDPRNAADAEVLLDAKLSLRPAAEEDLDGLRKAVQSGLLLDPDWRSDPQGVLRDISARLERLFEDAEVRCLVVCHGKRVIAMSLLDSGIETPNHLVSGPLVLAEYRNRGIGSVLLGASLRELAGCGLLEVRGVVPRNGTAARFVYPKFGGVMEECPVPPLESAA